MIVVESMAPFHWIGRFGFTRNPAASYGFALERRTVFLVAWCDRWAFLWLRKGV